MVVDGQGLKPDGQFRGGGDVKRPGTTEMTTARKRSPSSGACGDGTVRVVPLAPVMSWKVAPASSLRCHCSRSPGCPGAVAVNVAGSPWSTVRS